jgi:hypothetical protein
LGNIVEPLLVTMTLRFHLPSFTPSSTDDDGTDKRSLFGARRRLTQEGTNNSVIVILDPTTGEQIIVSGNVTDGEFRTGFAVGTYRTDACGVSNDPAPSNNGILYSLTVCNVTQYQCPIPAISHRNGSAVLIRTSDVVPFDYDIHYNPRADFYNQVLPFVEESVLESAAQAMGIIAKCIAGSAASTTGDSESTQRNTTQRRQRWIRHGLRRILSNNETWQAQIESGSSAATTNFFTELQRERVLGLALSPIDILDRRYNETCTTSSTDTISTNVVPVETHEESDPDTGLIHNVTTYTTETIIEPASCLPIRGAMSVWFLDEAQRDPSGQYVAPTSSSFQEGIRRNIQRFLDQEMNVRQSFRVAGNIEKVAFVGNRTTLYPGAAVNETATVDSPTPSSVADEIILPQSINENDSLSTGSKILIGLSSFVIITMILSMLLVRNRRHGKRAALAFEDSLALKPQRFRVSDQLGDDAEGDNQSPSMDDSRSTSSLSQTPRKVPYDPDNIDGEVLDTYDFYAIGEAEAKSSPFAKSSSDSEEMVAIAATAALALAMNRPSPTALHQTPTMMRTPPSSYYRENRSNNRRDHVAPESWHAGVPSIPDEGTFSVNSENTPRRTLQMS